MSDNKLPSGSSILGDLENIKALTQTQQEQIMGLFKYLEVAHEHLARACSMIATLLRSLNLAQLMMVLKVSVCLFI